MRWLLTPTVIFQALLGCNAVAADADSRLPVPDPAAKSVAERRINELVGADQKASARDSRIAMAKQMMAQPDVANSDIGVFYVLLREAQSAWVKAGDVRMALDAERRLSETFKVPEPEVRARKLSIIIDALKLGQRTPGFTPLELLENVLDLGEECFAAGDMKEAARAAQVGQLAQQGKDPLLTLRARTLVKQIEAAQRARAAADAAEAKLKSSPDDVASHLALGRYQCFVSNDWARGAVHLAKSSDPAIRAAAEKELTVHTPDPSPEIMRAAADAWWNVSRHATQAIPQDLASRRAAYWYRRLLPSQTGTQRLQLLARLKELQQGAAHYSLLMRNYERDGVDMAFCMDNPRVPDELQLSVSGNEVRIIGTKRSNAIDINGQLVAHCGKAVFAHMPIDPTKFSAEGALAVGTPRQADGTNYLAILLDKTGHIKHVALPVEVGKAYIWHLTVSDETVTLLVEDDGKGIGRVVAPLNEIKAFGFGSNVRYPGNKSDLRIEFQ